MESVFLLLLVYPEKPENSVAKATKLEYVKKNTKNYGKSIVKIRISCYDVQEIELIHFLFAEEGCFTSFI